MPQTKPLPTVLPTAAIEQLKSTRLGKLYPRILAQAEAVDAVFFDTFDGHILQSHRLLTWHRGHLHLGTGLQEMAQVCPQPPGFVANLPQGPVKQGLGMVPPLRSLMAMGAAKIQDLTLAYIDDEGKTQARLGLWILTHESGASLCLAQPIALRGYTKAIAELRAHIRELGANSPGWPHLYETLFPNWQNYTAKPQVDMAPTTPAIEMVNAVIAAHIPMMRQNEAGIIADIDTEFLHDYRIALRKIRSVISLFSGVYGHQQTADLKSEFSALMAPTGKLRDLDVYLLTRSDYAKLLPPDLHPGLAHMFARFSEHRAAAHAELAQQLQSPAYGAQMKRLEKLFKKGKKLVAGPRSGAPAHDFACSLIWKHYRKICKIAAGITETTPDEQVHALRIQCKKLRYLMEISAPLFSKSDMKDVIRPLKQLQDTLGQFNDYCVQQDNLRAFLGTLGPAERKENIAIAQTVGALIALMHQGQIAQRAKVEASFAAFNSPNTQNSFQTLFHSQKEPA